MEWDWILLWNFTTDSCEHNWLPIANINADQFSRFPEPVDWIDMNQFERNFLEINVIVIIEFNETGTNKIGLASIWLQKKIINSASVQKQNGYLDVRLWWWRIQLYNMRHSCILHITYL